MFYKCIFRVRVKLDSMGIVAFALRGSGCKSVLVQASKRVQTFGTAVMSHGTTLSSPGSLQVVEDGYEFFARRQLVTLFSAPNYCGDYDNAGGMMSVDNDLMCSFQVCSESA